MTKKNKKSKIKFFYIIIVILISININSLLGDWKQIINNLSQTIELSDEYDKLLEEKEKKEAETVKLTNDEYKIRYAMEKYGYTKSGQLILKVKDKSN